MTLTTSEQEATFRLDGCGPLGSDELPKLTEGQRRKALEPREDSVGGALFRDKAEQFSDRVHLKCDGSDLAQKIIEVRHRNKLLPDHFGAVQLNRLYGGGVGLGPSLQMPWA